MSINFLKKRGSALVYALVIMAVVSIIITAVIQYVVSHTRYAIFSASKKEAFQIAEAGASFYQWYLIHSLKGKSSEEIRDFWENGHPVAVGTPACDEADAYEVEYTDPGGGALGKYCLEITPPSSQSTNVTVKSTGWTYKYPNNKVTIQIRLNRVVWSDYIILADSMFRLNKETVVHGRMHSNTGIHFDGVTYNTATSASNTYCDADSDVTSGQSCTDGDGKAGHMKSGVWTAWANEYNSDFESPVFQAGKIFPTDFFDFNNIENDFSLMKEESKDPDTGIFFDNSGEGRHIIINPDGITMSVCTVATFDSESSTIEKYLQTSKIGTCNSCEDSKCRLQYDIPAEGIIFVEDNVWIEGIVNGRKISVIAADLDNPEAKKNIYLEKGLKYTKYDGSDAIGLIAQNDIEIVEKSSNNLRIDAAMMAKNGRVGGKDYGDVLHNLTIYGSIVSKGRVDFDFVTGAGYQNCNITYDDNLLNSPPPYFPSSSQYLPSLWEEL